MLKIRFDGQNLSRKWVLLVDASQDLTEPLKAFGAYLRKKAKEHFANEGPGWAPLAQSTDKRLVHSFAGGKFTSQGTVRKATAKRMMRTLAQQIRKGKASVHSLIQLKNTLNGNAHNDEIVKGLLGFTTAQLQGEKSSKASAKLEKQLSKLQALTPAERKTKLKKNREISKHKLLGKLASSIRSSIRSNNVTVYSDVPWAGVHNQGGSAGHGAKIPKRTFLELDDEDLKVLATLLEGHLTEEFDQGG